MKFLRYLLIFVPLTIVSADGKSNWLEGAQLLAVHLIFALGFFLLAVQFRHIKRSNIETLKR